MLLDNMACCGLREIDNLSEHSTPEEALLSTVRDEPYHDYGTGEVHGESAPDPDEWDTSFRHVIFTQAGRGEHYGRDFAAFILRERLGTVVETPSRVNPNSGNPLKAWIWTVNHRAVQQWIRRWNAAHPTPTTEGDEDE